MDLSSSFSLIPFVVRCKEQTGTSRDTCLWSILHRKPRSCPSYQSRDAFSFPLAWLLSLPWERKSDSNLSIPKLQLFWWPYSRKHEYNHKQRQACVMTAFFVPLLLLMEGLSNQLLMPALKDKSKNIPLCTIASVLIWQALDPRTLMAFQGESSQKIDADVSCKLLVFTIIVGFKYLKKRFDLWGMAALAAQKFIHPQEHIYQLKWVSKDRSLELI